MFKKLMKCLTVNEIYFLKIAFIDGGINQNGIIEINPTQFAKDTRMSPQTIRNAIRVLELVGIIETWTAGKGKFIKVQNIQMISALVRTLEYCD